MLTGVEERNAHVQAFYIIEPRMTRVALLEDSQFPPDVKKAAGELHERGVAFPNIYRLLAHTPDLLRGWMDIVWPLQEAQWADRPLREILIMYTGFLTQSRYTWAHHWPLAIAAGVPPEKLQDLLNWPESTFFDPKERAALGFTKSLVETHQVPQDIYLPMMEQFSATEIIHVALTVSQYTGVCHFFSAFELDVEPSYEAVPPLPVAV